MTIQAIIKNNIKRLLASRGFALTRVPSMQNYITMQAGLKAIADRKQPLNTVIDIGASDGRWAAQMMEYYPSCHYLLVEALALHEKALKRFCQRHPNAEYVIAAAGNTLGDIHFDASDPFGGHASYTPFDSSNVVVPMTTIDELVRLKGLEGPFLVKLDTHGFEVPILEGSTETLKETEAIVIECYNFHISPESLLFYEMCAYLKEYGFRCIDLVDPLHRPYDHTFWQMDLIFVRNDRPEFDYTKYK